MHRQRNLSARLPAGRTRSIAARLERRGVAATYALHDGALANRSARRRFSAAAAPLDELQRNLLTELDANRFAVVPFADLVPHAAPVGEEGSERSASQLWHLDFDDKHLLKAFLYLNDVDAAAGPFEYVPGSQARGRYDSIWHWSPTRSGRIPDEEVRRNVPADGVKTFTAPRGTLILC